MKKLTLIIIALSLFSLSSCKKAYNCTCKDSKTSEEYKAILTGYNSIVTSLNEDADEEMETTEYEETVTTLAKASKAKATESCPLTSQVRTEYKEFEDYNDTNGNGNFDEPGYSVTEVWTNECSLEKE